MKTNSIMKTPRIHYLQHVPYEGLGFIENWTSENKYILTGTKLYENAVFPELSNFDCLIILGGSMGVYDEDNFQWLKDEKLFISNAISANKKVLGICLGAQLIATCLGAKVVTAKSKEIGWFPVYPTQACESITWLYELFKDNPIVFHWHGDQFQIPNNCSNLLLSVANTNQAFYYGENVIGLQFHLEVTEQSTALMLANGANELIESECIQTVSDIEFGKQHIEHCNKIMRAILEKLNK
jgi:GMP synthase-like glutamine amidotransferase